MGRDTPWDAVMTAALFSLLLVAALAWRQAVVRPPTPSGVSGSREPLRKEPPMPGPTQTADPSGSLLEAVVHANPFSPMRRHVPEAVTPSIGTSPTNAPPAPVLQLVYKGQVLMGQRRRAILEEVKSRKTYFLQVGQEVAGFKLLDIAETQVVLSDPRSQEPVVLTLTPTP